MDDSTAIYPAAFPQHHHRDSKVRITRPEDRFDNNTYESVCILHRTDLVFWPLCVNCVNKERVCTVCPLHVWVDYTCMLTFCLCFWQVSARALIYADTRGVCVCEQCTWAQFTCVKSWRNGLSSWMSGFSLLQVWELFCERVQLYEKLYRVRSLDCWSGWCRFADSSIVLSSQICHDSYCVCACGGRWAFTQSLRRGVLMEGIPPVWMSVSKTSCVNHKSISFYRVFIDFAWHYFTEVP